MATNNWYDYVYASSDDKFDINDTYITSVSAADKAPLAAGGSYTITKDITIPIGAQGKPYLLFVTDRDRHLVESNENNNVKAVAALAATDLTVTSVAATSPSQVDGTTSVTWTVKNKSDRAANSTWYDYVYASADKTIDATDIIVGKVKHANVTPLSGGSSYTSSLDLNLPATAADKPYLIVVADGNHEQIEADETNNKVGDILTVTDRLGHTISYNYDVLNRRISSTDALNHTDTITYNCVGNILSITDALAHSTSYTYDTLNRRKTSTDALGQTQAISYDKVGNVLSTTDKLGRTTNYGYDSRNRLSSTTDALEHSTSISYNTEGNVLATTDELNHTTTYSYDLNNRLVKSTDALNQQRSISYDKVGNIGSSTDELGRTTTYTYDGLNRRTAITDALGHATTYTYDAVGNRTQFADALNQTTKYVYDSLNRQIRVIDAKNQITTTGYDAVGNLLAITDSVGNITRYTYDALNRQITDTNQLGKTRSYGYDAVGDLISEIDRNGRKRTYDYDELNRETAEHWLDSSGTDIRTFNYNYDAVGHLLGTNDPDSKYTYTYDAVDRMTSVDNLGTIGVPNVLMNYSYDAAGNLLSVTDKINGVQKGTNSYAYDILNRVTRLTQSGTGVTDKRVDMSYDAASQMTGLNRYGDLAGTLSVANTSYTYDLAGRLTNLKHQRGATTLASYGLAYDAANRITQSSGTDGTQDYAYDTTNQLTGASHTTQTNEAYSYDANGNRTNAGYGTGTNNQLLTDGTYNYQYDGEGNRTRRTEIATGKITEYVWDYRNRLTSVLFKDSLGTVTKTIQYTYDVNDRRIGKKIDGAVAERYVYDGSDIALVFDGAGNQTHRYLHGTGVDTVLADERGGAVVWALADNQGTIRDIVDGNGTILNHVSYDSFGRVKSQSNPSVEFRFGYTGREQDTETGLDYYRARYYDAEVGRFISEDPIGFNAGDTNIYRYVGNSPTNFTDPSGEVAFVPIAVGVVVSYAIGQAFAPDPAQAPMSRCDNHPTPPNQELTRATIELGVGAAPTAITSIEPI